MESFHTDSAHQLIISTCAMGDGQWSHDRVIPHYGVGHALFDKFYDAKWQYDHILVVENCNIVPYIKYGLVCSQLPIWHAALVCFQQERPRRVLLIDEVDTLAVLQEKQLWLELCKGMAKVQIETVDLGETPQVTDGNLDGVKVETDMYYRDSLTQELAHASKELLQRTCQTSGIPNNKVHYGVSYQVELPRIKLFMYFVSVGQVEDAHYVLTQQDEVRPL